MATRRDPSSTGVLAWAFARDIRFRFNTLAKEISLKVENDSDALLTGTQLLQAFDKWVAEIAELTILPTDGFGKSWVKKYVEAAYTKGITRAYSDAHSFVPNSIDYVLGAKDQFRKTLMAHSDIQDTLNLLVSHTVEQLRGLTNFAVSQAIQILSSDLIHGGMIQNANNRVKRVAKAMAKKIQETVKHRSDRIARDELVRAQAEGQLDSFEAQGVETVGLYAEWSSAKDERVCPLCLPLDGVQFTIQEARGIIPRHENCRCGWSLGEVYAKENRKRTVRRRLGDSILAERKQKGKTKADRIRAAKRESVWAGARLVPSKRRKGK